MKIYASISLQFFIALTFFLAPMLSGPHSSAAVRCDQTLRSIFDTESSSEEMDPQSLRTYLETNYQSKNKIYKSEVAEIKSKYLKAGIANEAFRLAKEIQAQFPSDQYFIIGLGGSPAIVVAAMQVLRPESAINLSLSIPKLPDLTSDRIGFKRQLTSFQSGQVQEHLRFFLPSAEQLNGRKILLMDYTVTGDSLRIAAAEINKYYANTTAPPQVVQLSFLSEVGVFNKKMSIRKNIIASSDLEKFIAVNTELVEILHHQDLKPYTEYESYIPGFSTPGKRPSRAAYRYLKQFLQSSGEYR